MAIKKNGVISGLTGNLINYTSLGKEIVRVHVPHPDQSKATKASAKDFGKIKRISRFLRKALADVMKDYKGKPAMFAMDEAVRRWYYNFYQKRETAVMDPVYFSSLQLRPEAPPFAKMLLGVDPVVDWSQAGKLVLQIPAMKRTDLMLPRYANRISFTLVISGVGLRGDEKIKLNATFQATSETVERNVRVDDIDAVTFELGELEPLTNALFVVFLALRYEASSEWLEEERWKPVLVVGSRFGE